ncbi:MAG: hypothetical protein V1848_01135 [Candidatus Magasanikbacteria bacterium]
MGTFSDLDKIVQRLGNQRIGALIDSKNAERVKAFCGELTGTPRQQVVTCRRVPVSVEEDNHGYALDKMIPQFAFLLGLLGTEKFSVLVDPSHVRSVSDFCNGLVRASLPVEFTVNGRTYEVIRFVTEEEEEGCITGEDMLERASSMETVNYDDIEHLRRYASEIPEGFNDFVMFVFPTTFCEGRSNPDYGRPSGRSPGMMPRPALDGREVSLLLFRNGKWQIVKLDMHLAGFTGRFRFLRRKKS